MAFVVGLPAAGEGTLDQAYSGISESAIDRRLRPQDDLYEFANGAWIRSIALGPDVGEVTSFTELRQRAETLMRDEIWSLAAKRWQPGSEEQKLTDFYAAFVDVSTIDHLEMVPVQEALREIDAIRDAHDLAAFWGRSQGLMSLPLTIWVGPALDAPERNVAALEQDGLGLPDRDFYTSTEDRLVRGREGYLLYVRKLLQYAGDDDPAMHAARVLELEARLASAQASWAMLRDPAGTWHPMALGVLVRTAPGIDWNAFLGEAGLAPERALNVAVPSYVAALAGLVQATPIETWRRYLKVRRLDAAARVLPANFRAAHREFHAHVLRGQAGDAPRWQEAMVDMNDKLRDALGKRYAAKVFPPSSKARVEGVVAELKATYREVIDKMTWLSPETRKAMQVKLAEMVVLVGYPDQWRDYGALDVRAGDAFGNRDRAAAFGFRFEMAKVGRAVDRREWGLGAQVPNAYYDPASNTLVDTAADLQPPFFDPDADEAFVFGTAGADIAGVMSDAFFSSGRDFDAKGRFHDWWTPADRAAMAARIRQLIGQYDNYEALPGHHVDGHLTQDENLSDLVGLQVAFRTYARRSAGHAASVIDDRTGEQRFFVAWAQQWRAKIRDARVLYMLGRDPHSPNRFRADGAAINVDAFHEAFGTKPGDGMWKAPEERIRLW